MTITPRPKQGEYNANYDPRPKTITVGVSLISVETETIIQDGQAIVLPVEDDVLYLAVPRELSNDWEAVALQAEGKGYLRRHWRIMSVWATVPDHIANDII